MKTKEFSKLLKSGVSLESIHEMHSKTQTCPNCEEAYLQALMSCAELNKK